MRTAIAACAALLCSACTAESPATQAQPSSTASSGTSVETRDKPVAPERVLDPLTMTLVLGKPRGDQLPAKIRIRNRSGQTVIDPGCLISNYSFGVVPVSKPGARLDGVVRAYCMGKRRLPDGFSQTQSLVRFSLRGLSPGKYLAVIDFGKARTERLSAEFRLR